MIWTRTWPSPTKLTWVGKSPRFLVGGHVLKFLFSGCTNMCSSRFATTQKTVKNHKTKKPPKLPPQALLILDVFSQNQGTADVAQQGAAFFFSKKKHHGRKRRGLERWKVVFWLVFLQSQRWSGGSLTKKSDFPGRFSRSSVGFVFFVSSVTFFFSETKPNVEHVFYHPDPPPKKWWPSCFFQKKAKGAELVASIFIAPKIHGTRFFPRPTFLAPKR